MADDLAYLLDDFVAQTPGLVATHLASSDGLKKCSSGMDNDEADKLSAVLSGLVSLCRGYPKSTLLGTAATQFKIVTVDLGDLLLFGMNAGEGSVLGVLAQTGSDPGLIAYGMSKLVQDLRGNLATPARTKPLAS